MTQTQVPKCVICGAEAFELTESRTARERNPSLDPKYYYERSGQERKYNCPKHAMQNTFKKVKDNEDTVNQILSERPIKPAEQRRLDELAKVVEASLDRVMLQNAMGDSSRRVVLAKTFVGSTYLSQCEGLINALNNPLSKEMFDKRAAELADTLGLLSREHNQANFGQQSPQFVADNFYRSVTQLFSELSSYQDRAGDINDALEELRRLRSGGGVEEKVKDTEKVS